MIKINQVLRKKVKIQDAILKKILHESKKIIKEEVNVEQVKEKLEQSIHEINELKQNLDETMIID
jgi:hypothetical protein